MSSAYRLWLAARPSAAGWLRGRRNICCAAFLSVIVFFGGFVARPNICSSRRVEPGNPISHGLGKLSVDPRQGRPRGIEARGVGELVAFDDATDCRRHRGELVGGEVNGRHP
jgi:hypothetical protein